MKMQDKCKNCGKLIDNWVKNRWRPFCSERCRLIDLGEWLTENHRIPTDELPEFECKEDDFKSH